MKWLKCYNGGISGAPLNLQASATPLQSRAHLYLSSTFSLLLSILSKTQMLEPFCCSTQPHPSWTSPMGTLLLPHYPSCLLNSPRSVPARSRVSSRRGLCSEDRPFHSCSHSSTFYLPGTRLVKFSTAVLTSSMSPAPLISLAPAFFSAGLFNLFLDH